MTLPARLGIVTLGVEDLARSIAFYKAIGWERKPRHRRRDRLVRHGRHDIGLFPRHELAAGREPAPEPRAPFGGITLAINVDSPDAVRAALDAAVAAAARS